MPNSARSVSKVMCGCVHCKAMPADMTAILESLDSAWIADTSGIMTSLL